MKPVFDEADKKHKLYNTWWNMLARCYVDYSPGYAGYGGRGITVSDDWLTFKKFAADMGNVRPVGTSLDRIDNDGNYCAKNCKWSSRSDQMLNRRQFGNNTSGETGVVKIVDRHEARFHYEGVRYRIGRFDTVAEAKLARLNFIKLFNSDKEAALLLVEKETLWCTSTTNLRGITAHKDGGFVLRVTENKVRKYLGYFKTMNEALDARREYDTSRNCKT